jgi:lambda family phage minor tail protein L
MIESDVQKLNPGSIVTLYELDATELGGGLLRWHNGVNELGNDVVWRGFTYSRFPVEATGFERSGKGAMPRPTLKVANISGLIGALARELNDLVGTKLTRRRTFLKYLDAANFPGGVNVQADPNVGFSDEIWTIDRKSTENGIYVEFDLSSAFDVQGTKLPKRICIQNTCVSRYRGAECGYSGPPVATKFDDVTTVAALDVCGKRLTSCRLRFGVGSELPYGGFSGVGLLR